MNEEGKLMLEFLSNKFGTSDQKQIQKKLSKLDKEQQQALAQEYQQWKAKKKTKAAHGAKLDYVKSLKHICPEGEELVYFKQGGSVGCGCKKKEDGGEVVKANMGVVANFRKDQKKKQQQQNQQQQKPKWTDVEDNELKKLSEKKNPTPQEKQRLQQLRNKFKNSSNTKDYEVEEGKKGMKVEKDCGGSSIVKKFKAKCGSKMKKHEQGGSLNGIPFYQKGTNEGGIKREIKLPEYMTKQQIGYPSILPGRYTGLERLTPGIFGMFKTWLKGLPKTLTPMDYISTGAGAATGIGLGYDDTHNQYVRKWITNTEKSLQPPPQTPSKPFIEFIKK